MTVIFTFNIEPSTINKQFNKLSGRARVWAEEVTSREHRRDRVSEGVMRDVISIFLGWSCENAEIKKLGNQQMKIILKKVKIEEYKINNKKKIIK